MEVDDIPHIDPNVDYNLIQPIHQKRTIAFVNQFLLSTVSFLNSFASTCESRLMQFEYKLQKIEAALLILESQLSSIPDLNDVKSNSAEITIDLPEPEVVPSGEVQNCASEDQVDQSNSNPNSNNTMAGGGGGPKASSDPRFSKFFKMSQFGVPIAAIRVKMKLEGVDPSILDNPNAVIPGYEAE